MTNPTGASDCYDVGFIGVGVECPVNADFLPMTAGRQTGVITVTDNGVNQQQIITATGIGSGTAPPVTLTPFLLSFSTLQGTTSDAQALMLTNSGTPDVLNAIVNVTDTAGTQVAELTGTGMFPGGPQRC